MRRKLLLNGREAHPNAMCVFNGSGGINLDNYFDLNLWLGDYAVELEFFGYSFGVQAVFSSNVPDGGAAQLGQFIFLDYTGLRIATTETLGYSIGAIKHGSWNTLKYKVVNNQLEASLNGSVYKTGITRPATLTRFQKDFYGCLSANRPLYPNPDSKLKNVFIRDANENIVIEDYYQDKVYTPIGVSPEILPISA